MDSLLTLGSLVRLDELARDLTARIEARGLGPPAAFARWAEQILLDHPERRALVLPAGTRIKGDVVLDFAGGFMSGIGTIACLGALTIDGRLINEDPDGGPFMFVDGDLRVGQIEKGGANLIVLGSIGCDGVVFCEYSHGTLLVAGDVTASALITCDQAISIGGSLNAPLVSSEEGNMRASLVAVVFLDPDDPDDDMADGDLIRARLAEGLPILK